MHLRHYLEVTRPQFSAVRTVARWKLERYLMVT